MRGPDGKTIIEMIPVINRRGYYEIDPNACAEPTTDGIYDTEYTFHYGESLVGWGPWQAFGVMVADIPEDESGETVASWPVFVRYGD